MPDQMTNETDQKMSRREFLKLAGAGVGAALLDAACGIKPTAAPTATPEPTKPPMAAPTLSEPQVVSTFEANIKATDQARSQYDLNRDLEKIPPNLIFSTMIMAIYLKEPEGKAGMGTATIVFDDTKKKVVYGLAAGHGVEAIVPGSENAKLINLLQPQFGENNLIVNPKDITAIKSEEGDVGVFAIKYSKNFPIGSFGLDKIKSDWRPNTTEPLFILSYPWAAEKNKAFPVEIRLTDTIFSGGIVSQDGCYAALSKDAGPGSSGSLVVTSNGEAVGVATGISIRDGREYILISPITANEFIGLKDKLTFSQS